jgi:hypothetical protein
LCDVDVDVDADAGRPVARGLVRRDGQIGPSQSPFLGPRGDRRRGVSPRRWRRSQVDPV